MPVSEAPLADGSPPLAPLALLARIEALGIRHHTVEHVPVYTVEESKRLRGDLPGGHIKNLFLRNKRGRMWLVTCHEDRRIDLRSLGDAIGGGRLSFASPERLARHLGVVPGAVTPLAAVNDRTGVVEVVLDARLMAMSPVHVHPLDNAMTTAMEPGDLVRFLEAVDHPPRIVDLDLHAASG